MSKEFLYTLLDSMSVSGHEIPLQKKVIAEMTPHCDKIITDYTGNVVCVLNPDAPFKVTMATSGRMAEPTQWEPRPVVSSPTVVAA